jgi:hypothetical protein
MSGGACEPPKSAGSILSDGIPCRLLPQTILCGPHLLSRPVALRPEPWLRPKMDSFFQTMQTGGNFKFQNMTVIPEASSERPDTVLAPAVSLRGTFFPSTRTPRARAGAPGPRPSSDHVSCLTCMNHWHELVSMLLSPTGAYPVAYPVAYLRSRRRRAGARSSSRWRS